jgi:hypothetical protein
MAHGNFLWQNLQQRRDSPCTTPEDKWLRHRRRQLGEPQFSAKPSRHALQSAWKEERFQTFNEASHRNSKRRKRQITERRLKPINNHQEVASNRRQFKESTCEPRKAGDYKRNATEQRTKSDDHLRNGSK